MLNELWENVTLENYNNFNPITGKIIQIPFVIINYLKVMSNYDLKLLL
ncbi:hypothetical protein [Spiroplasma endosymbiont of Polydrusus formosus]